MSRESTEEPDFYIESGKYVFTIHYHLKRGYCCGSRCRHCPFEPRYRKGNRELQKELKK